MKLLSVFLTAYTYTATIPIYSPRSLFAISSNNSNNRYWIITHTYLQLSILIGSNYHSINADIVFAHQSILQSTSTQPFRHSTEMEMHKNKLHLFSYRRCQPHFAWKMNERTNSSNAGMPALFRLDGMKWQR